MIEFWKGFFIMNPNLTVPGPDRLSVNLFKVLFSRHIKALQIDPANLI